MLKHDISADYGMVKFDLSRVYNHVAGVKKLERTFVFDRKNGGSFTVTDEAKFSPAADFEDAVITLGEVKELSHGKYLISWQGKSLELNVKSNVPFKFSIDTIKEETYHKLPIYRLAFTALEKAEDVKIEFLFTEPISKVRD